jgi:hypothetical protein
MRHGVKQELTGQRFSRLLVLGEMVDHPRAINRGRSLWACACDCGNFALVFVDALRGGHTQSCGCMRREAIDKVRKQPKPRLLSTSKPTLPERPRAADPFDYFWGRAA